MEHKHASQILTELSKKDMLTAEEKQAVLLAVGVLAWTSLAQSRIKRIGSQR